MLPKIRSNQADESELSLLIGDYNNSPFEREKFLTVLNARQKEIETAEFIIYHEDLATIPNKYVDLDNSGDMAECVIGNDYSVVYELQILPKGRLHSWQWLLEGCRTLLTIYMLWGKDVKLLSS